MATGQVWRTEGTGTFSRVTERSFPFFLRTFAANLVGTQRDDLFAWDSDEYWIYKCESGAAFRSVERAPRGGGWRRIAKGHFSTNSHDDLVILDEFGTGVSFFSVSAGGSLLPLMPPPFVANVQISGGEFAWTDMVGGRFGTGPLGGFMVFSQFQQAAAFFTTDGFGRPVQVNGPLRSARFPVLAEGWARVLSGRFFTDSVAPGLTDLVFLDPRGGKAAFCTTDGSGNLTVRTRLTTLPREANQILAGQFSGSAFDDLVFYDRESGRLNVFTSDGQGGLSPIESVTNVGEGFDRMEVGNFTDSRFTDVFLYNR